MEIITDILYCFFLTYSRHPNGHYWFAGICLYCYEREFVLSLSTKYKTGLITSYNYRYPEYLLYLNISIPPPKVFTYVYPTEQHNAYMSYFEMAVS